MFSKLAEMAIPPWVYVVVLGGIVGGIYGAGLWTGLKLSDGKLARCEMRVAAERTAVTERDRQLTIRDKALASVRTKLEAAEKARDEADARYFAEVNKPPKVVIRYRQAEAEVPDAVTGENCVEFLASGLEHVKAALGGDR